MQCATCAKEFVAKRSTAKFCSDTCRVDYARRRHVPGTNVILDLDAPEPPEMKVTWNPGPAPEKEKKGHCSECVTFESGIHWCPNKTCECFETEEEQEKSLEAFQTACPHPPEEFYMMRCLLCGKIGESIPRTGKHLRTRGCEKHHGAFTCGCVQKED